MSEPASENTSPETIQVNPEMTSAIVSQVGADNITEDQVALVLEAWNSIHTGPPVGTICRNTETGAIAHRVIHEGMHAWRVSSPDGTQWVDLNPSLNGWETLVEGQE